LKSISEKIPLFLHGNRRAKNLEKPFQKRIKICFYRVKHVIGVDSTIILPRLKEHIHIFFKPFMKLFSGTPFRKPLPFPWVLPDIERTGE
jgi:hypothetical protein